MQPFTVPFNNASNHFLTWRQTLIKPHNANNEWTRRIQIYTPGHDPGHQTFRPYVSLCGHTPCRDVLSRGSTRRWQSTFAGVHYPSCPSLFAHLQAPLHALVSSGISKLLLAVISCKVFTIFAGIRLLRLQRFGPHSSGDQLGDP